MWMKATEVRGCSGGWVGGGGGGRRRRRRVWQLMIRMERGRFRLLLHDTLNLMFE